MNHLFCFPFSVSGRRQSGSFLIHIDKILVCLLMTLTALSGTPVQCGEEKVLEILSPRNRHLAVLFIRNCGETTTPVSHVNLFSGNRSIDRKQEGVMADGEIFVVTGTADIEMTWKNRTTLSIQCGNCSTLRVISAQEKWNDVQIQYDLK